jgi:hypothetical protein
MVIFWIDIIGDKLEAEGVDPGNLWESTARLNEGLEEGLVLVTNIGPGCPPQSPLHLSRVFWRRLDAFKGPVVEEVSPWNALFVSKWRQVMAELR